MADNVIVIVISPKIYNWGENCLLDNGELAYSDCTTWSNTEMNNWCFALVEQGSDGWTENVKKLMSARSTVCLWWHDKSDLSYTKLNLDSSKDINFFSHSDGDGNHPLQLFMQSVAALPLADGRQESPTTCSSFTQYGGDCKNKFNNLVNSCLGKTNLELIPELLPLDIDMQMLKDLKAEQAKEYLKRMLDETSDYKKRFERIQELRSKIKDAKVQNYLKDLIGKNDESSPLHEFLVSLDALRSKNTLTTEDVKSAVDSSESLKKETFHQWYQDMASCLKGRRMCSE